MACWATTRAIIMILLSVTLLIVNECCWRATDPKLANWIMINTIFYLFVSVSKIIEQTYKSIECFDSCFLFFLRRVMAYISVTFKVITPFYFFFLFGWTIFGIYLTSNNLWYVPFSFRFVVLLIVVLQFTLMIFFMIIGLIAGYFFITCKERAVYETYKTDKLEGERENLIKNEIEEENPKLYLS